MYCKECGTENKKSNKFCLSCGNKLISDSVVVSSKNIIINKDKGILAKAVDRVSSKADDTFKKIKQGSNSEELLRWHELFLRGVLTEEEFNEKKRELI